MRLPLVHVGASAPFLAPLLRSAVVPRTLPPVALAAVGVDHLAAAAGLLAPLDALPLAARDPLCTLVLVVSSVAWIKICNALAGSGLTSQYISRKLVHMGSGPLFVLCWPLFSSTQSGQIAACAVPVLSILRLVRAGSRADGGQADLVKAVSRSGDKKEALGGPMVYTIVLLASTLFGWRSLVSAVAICQMAIGDGMADIIGRRFGRTRWPTFLESTGKKSVEGSAAFAGFAFVASMLFVALFNVTGLSAIAPLAVAPRLLFISLACAFVELGWLPGDDNFIVPVTGAALSAVLLPGA